MRDMKISDGPKPKNIILTSSLGNGFQSDSFTQLRDDHSDVAFPTGTTKTSILVGEPSDDVESGQIKKSVTLEQSSDKVEM